MGLPHLSIGVLENRLVFRGRIQAPSNEGSMKGKNEKMRRHHAARASTPKAR